jgi:hypothetical protein
MVMDSSARWQFAVATLFTIASLALLAVSFGTDDGVVVTVKRNSLTPDNTISLYFSRNRGLFRTCYKGEPKLFLDNRDDVLDGNCLRQHGYEIGGSREETIDYGSNYDLRIHLMRTHVACFILGLFFYSVAVIVSLFGIYKMKFSLLQVTSVLVFVAAFFAAAGMAFFHGYDYIEKNKFDLTLGGGKGVDDDIKEDLYSYWKEAYPLIDNNSKLAYGYSYMLGWISVGLGGIAGMLFICSAFNQRDKVKAERRKERKMKKKELEYQGDNNFDNMAYNPYGSYMNYPTYDPYSAYAGGAYPGIYGGGGGSYPAITY